METNPALGVLLHAIGGLAAASFYAPLNRIKAWPWECFYLVMGLIAWLLTPAFFAAITVPGSIDIIRQVPIGALGLTLLFGLFWGIGAVSYGLTMRYLGMALGMSVALGFCAVFGTLLPPIVKGELSNILSARSGQIVILGIGLCVLGIGVAGYAGVRKEHETKATENPGDFKLWKGLIVAFICGLMSACFAYGMHAGIPIANASIEAGAKPLFQNNIVLVIILLGGLTTNSVWCLVLNKRNQTFDAYRKTDSKTTATIVALCAVAGVTWYFQFFFYGMGSTKMGDYDFASWSLHMAFIIVFGNLWGLYFKEWKDVSPRTLTIVWLGITILILSTVVIGYGNSLSTTPPSIH